MKARMIQQINTKRDFIYFSSVCWKDFFFNNFLENKF